MKNLLRSRASDIRASSCALDVRQALYKRYHVSQGPLSRGVTRVKNTPSDNLSFSETICRYVYREETKCFSMELTQKSYVSSSWGIPRFRSMLTVCIILPLFFKFSTYYNTTVCNENTAFLLRCRLHY